MKPGRLLLPALGIAVLLVVCAGTLLAGAYNRGGTPESTLRLSERELEIPASPESGKQENTPLTLRLLWRVETNDRAGWTGSAGSATRAKWITPTKLSELGIFIPGRVGPNTFVSLLLVLEFDGPSHARALSRACEPAGDTRDERACAFELKQSSRLYVVDAGRRIAELRQRYPDRTHFAIVPGVIKLSQEANGELRGFISGLSVETIQGKEPLRSAIDPATGRMLWHRLQGGHYFDAVICFGRRLEPWNASFEVRDSEAAGPISPKGGSEWEYRLSPR